MLARYTLFISTKVGIKINIPFIDLKRFEPGFHSALMAKLQEMTLNAQFIGGAEVSTLEARLAEKVEVSHAVTCANGTDALQLALRAVGVGEGDLVLVPEMTFWATFEAVINVGAKPITVDSCMADGGVDFAAFEEAVRTVQPKAALIAHLYGWGSAQLSGIRALCKQHGVVLVEDGAQAFGVKFEGSSIYRHAEISTTSFYPAKVLGAAGDGGAVFTNNKELADKVRSLSNHGRTAHYGFGDVGWNSRLDSIQAAFLNLSLDHIDQRIASRQSAARFYREQLEGCGLPVMQLPKGYEENGYCNVCIAPDQATKALLENKLKEAGIGFGNIYPSVMSSQPGAQKYLTRHFGGEMGKLLCSSVLNLPLFPYISESELNTVVLCVKQAMQETQNGR